MDNGVTGSTPLNERPGLSSLVEELKKMFDSGVLNAEDYKEHLFALATTEKQKRNPQRN